MHREHDKPYVQPELNITLQPLPFMEFSQEGVEQAVLFCPEGAVLVNVPDRARFAVHKLLVAGERKGAFATKSTKDLVQAAALLQYIAEHRPTQLQFAFADARSRGKGWLSRLDTGVAQFARRYPKHPALALVAPG